MIKQVIKTEMPEQAGEPLRLGDIVKLRDHVLFNQAVGAPRRHENHEREAVVMGWVKLANGPQMVSIVWSPDEVCVCRADELSKVGSIWDLPFPEASTTKGDASDGSL